MDDTLKKICFAVKDNWTAAFYSDNGGEMERMHAVVLDVADAIGMPEAWEAMGFCEECRDRIDEEDGCACPNS